MIIDVILGGTTQYENGIPYVVGGRPSQMDTADLKKRIHITDNENERTEATEYWLDGQLVHRSVNMHLKTGIFAAGFQARF